MKKFLIAFLVFLLWSAFALWVYSWLETSDIAINEETNVVSTELPENIETQGHENDLTDRDSTLIDADKDSISEIALDTDILKIDENALRVMNSLGEVVFLFSEGISISKNTSEISIPNSIIDFKYKLNTYMIEHPNVELHISSIYSPIEEVKSPNLGIQRGEKIKTILENVGIASEKIVIKSVIKDIEFKEDEAYDNSMYFAFKPLNQERIDAIKLELPDSKIVYPRFGDSGILINKALKDLKKELVALCKTNPEVKIRIVGHTDNIGNANDNYTRGLKYARQVRWYLIGSDGLARNRVVASSQGEAESIATNHTNEGRIANTRIEVIFE